MTDQDRIEHPLLDDGCECRMVSDLRLELCSTQHAVRLVRKWHSRLSKTQDGPWMYAFKAHASGYTYAVALWSNPSARTLPGDWLELRRLAISDDAPHNTGSWMLSKMVKELLKIKPETPKFISYQDVDVHSGTIYKAANWFPDYPSKPRNRDRSGLRQGTSRKYRKDINGGRAASSGKIRWAWEPGFNHGKRNCMINQKYEEMLDYLRSTGKTK